MVNSVPPEEVEGASWAGALKGDEGAGELNLLDAPNPVEGNPLLEPAGEAG